MKLTGASGSGNNRTDDDNVGFRSRAAKSRAVKKVREALPVTPKKIQILQQILTPNSKDILTRSVCLDSAGDRVFRSLQEKMAALKPHCTINNKKRPGYRLLQKVINMAGVRARKACGTGRIQSKSGGDGEGRML